MNRMSLERKLLCSQADRVADAEVAKIILETATKRPLKEYSRGNQKLVDYIEYVINKAEDGIEQAEPWDTGNGDLLTYGRVCARLAEKHESGEIIDSLMIRAVTCGHGIYERENSPRRQKKNGRAPGSDHEKRIFTRESLESRLKRAKKTVKEEKAQEQNEKQLSQKSLACCYSGMEEEQEISVKATTFVINRINMREYFQALSLITGKEEDADIPRTLPFCENMTLKELLDEECDSDEIYYERIYTLLIEPFAKIDAKMAAKQR